MFHVKQLLFKRRKAAAALRNRCRHLEAVITAINEGLEIPGDLAGVEPAMALEITKRITVAAKLGAGISPNLAMVD